MRKLIFTNPRGETIELGFCTPFLINKIDGLGKVDADVNTASAPYQDGEDYIDTTISPRAISVEGTFRKLVSPELYDDRQKMQRILNPKLGMGILQFEHKGVSRHIYAIADGSPAFSDEGMSGFQKYQIEFFCPNPYWRSPNETTKPLVAYTGGFTLPFTLPFTLGTSGSKTTVYNDGDVPAPVRIEMHGPTTNPQIFNRTTGKHLRINRTVAEGEVMRINTESGKQRIEITNENGETFSAFGYLDHDSSILSDFYLELGENIIEHVADAGNRHAEVIVRWDSMFVGV